MFGSNPQDVGAEDGTEDEWGDLLVEAARVLGRPVDQMNDETWQHFQDVAAGCRATNMAAWLTHLDAALKC